MARKARGRSQTGIYHVMLRGVNYQQIFEHGNDYRKFILILRDMVSLATTTAMCLIFLLSDARPRAPAHQGRR